MSVITISRQLGSGGDVIARQVCELLGYSYFDKALMAQVVEEMGITDTPVTDFSADGYQARGFLDDLFSRVGSALTSGALLFGTHAEVHGKAIALDEETSAGLVGVAIRALSDKGRIVVVGRGGQAILHGRPHVLHVRLVADPEERIPRLMEHRKLGRAEAMDYMNDRDQATAQYLKRFHNVEVNDPLLYHMILNTSLLGVDETVQQIVTVARNMGVVSRHADAFQAEVFKKIAGSAPKTLDKGAQVCYDTGVLRERIPQGTPTQETRGLRGVGRQSHRRSGVTLCQEIYRTSNRPAEPAEQRSRSTLGAGALQ